MSRVVKCSFNKLALSSGLDRKKCNYIKLGTMSTSTETNLVLDPVEVLGQLVGGKDERGQAVSDPLGAT